MQTRYLESPPFWSVCDLPTGYIFLNDTQEWPFRWKMCIITFRGRRDLPLCHIGWTERLLPTKSPVTHPQAMRGGSRRPNCRAAGFPGSGALQQKGFPPVEKLPGHPAQAQVPTSRMAICVAEEGWQRPCVLGAPENLSWKKVLFESLP